MRRRASSAFCPYCVGVGLFFALQAPTVASKRWYESSGLPDSSGWYPGNPTRRTIMLDTRATPKEASCRGTQPFASV